MSQTNMQFQAVAAECRSLFVRKHADYGSPWRFLRVSSLTDQLYIKAKRVRTLESGVQAQIAEGIHDEYIGLFNYAIMTLIQLESGVSETDIHMAEADVLRLYDAQVRNAFELMQKKNHDYGEAWREMRISSITDLILQKLLRVRQIEDNAGKTLVSEGLEANFLDIVNYSAFVLIRLHEHRV